MFLDDCVHFATLRRRFNYITVLGIKFAFDEVRGDFVAYCASALAHAVRRYDGIPLQIALVVKLILGPVRARIPSNHAHALCLLIISLSLIVPALFQMHLFYTVLCSKIRHLTIALNSNLLHADSAAGHYVWNGRFVRH